MKNFLPGLALISKRRGSNRRRSNYNFEYRRYRSLSVITDWRRNFFYCRNRLFFLAKQEIITVCQGGTQSNIKEKLKWLDNFHWKDTEI